MRAVCHAPDCASCSNQQARIPTHPATRERDEPAACGRRAGQQQGNSPQALTHLALISAAFNLDRALGA
jgi:GH15 family glucan-1,4-alpha-glucosidase